MADSAEVLKAQKESRANLIGGVDFIETEEDVEAVESAVVKIQNTFRGKKFRSKQAAGSTTKPPTTSTSTAATTTESSPSEAKQAAGSGQNVGRNLAEEQKLSERLEAIQVSRNLSSGANNKPTPGDTMSNRTTIDHTSGQEEPIAEMNRRKSSGSNPADLTPCDAERAAAKIQAGFKGYKTRKELGGKIGTSGATGSSGANLGSADSGDPPAAP